MRTILFIILGISMLICDNCIAQFNQLSSRSLFSDVKAFKQDDALMVLIVEDTEANGSTSTSEERNTKLSGSVAAGTSGSSFSGDASLGTGNTFKGGGSNSRSETIRSRLSARVIAVEPNGNLSIEGKRTSKVDGEMQTIVIKGIVRPVDIQPNNSVYSYNILDLQLFIEGKGNLSEIKEPGLITKFLRALF